MSTTPAAVTPADIGIGMRISVHPHTDRFVPVILGALEQVAASGVADDLRVETGAVSTWVGVDTEPAAQRLADYARELVVATSRAGDQCHLAVHLLLSRGCPGEASCDLTVRELPAEAPVVLTPTGLTTVAAWSLYPLDDSGDSHMDVIMRAIGDAAGADVTVTGTHYATELRGDLAAVLGVIFTTWAAAGAQVPHVVSHATLSLHSPTEEVSA